MLRYSTLIRILDSISAEAPEEFKSYHPDPDDHEQIVAARSRAYIHLFLKVKCGLTSFKERHALVTDGKQDGGVDAYYLDEDKKRLYLIQSKFRATRENFEEKSITADDLVKMEITRILRGAPTDSKEVGFNKQIKLFQERWRSISDHAHYGYIVAILGNLRNYSDEQVRRLIDDAEYTVYDFQKAYDELVFPLCSGTYYDPQEIKITISLGEKEQSTLKQKISTKHGDFQVRVVFVPAKEIGRILSQYKNSILKYNPRNYLSLSQNKVNQNIRDSIVNTKTNDFAILNNGITIICDSFQLSDMTGVVDVGQIIITNPQIINGGQTAYTLSKVYETYRDHLDDMFGNKEVLLKAIITSKSEERNIRLIEEIANATNQQSRVEEADRRSNELVQVQIQQHIFKDFGYFYERKRGEFYNGLDCGYIGKELVIDRYDFFRAYYALTGQPRWARQRGNETLFAENNFKKVFKNSDDYRRMVFAYFVLKHLRQIEKEANDESWGLGLRYGKMAVISAISYRSPAQDINKQTLGGLVSNSIEIIKPEWRAFEEWVKGKEKNGDYVIEGVFDYDNYYKGKTVNADVKEYFEKEINNRHQGSRV